MLWYSHFTWLIWDNSCDRCVWNLTNVNVVDRIEKLPLNMSDEKVPPLNAATVSVSPEYHYVHTPVDRDGTSVSLQFLLIDLSSGEN